VPSRSTGLDSWSGVGAVVGGMRRLGYDVELKQFPMAWRVKFAARGDEHVVALGAAGGVGGARQTS